MCETIHALSCLTSKQLHEVGSIAIPILQMQKLRLTKITHPVQGKVSKLGLPAYPAFWCPLVNPSRYTINCFLTKELSLKTTSQSELESCSSYHISGGIGVASPTVHSAPACQLLKMCCSPPHPASVQRLEF